MKIPFGRPLIGNEEKLAVQRVLSGDILVHGPVAKQFEADFAGFTGAPYAVSLSSCTAALHLAYFYLGIGAGDEVIVPAQTHTATAHAVELCRATPIFVDAEISTGNVDLDLLEESITPHTKAISVVHFLGVPVDMARVMEIAKRHDLFVVEDCALAVGTKFEDVHAGLHGDVGCFSFYPVKQMTTSEGGMLICRDEKIAERVRLQRAFGVDRTVSERKSPGIYDVIDLGFNYRMSEIEAAIGIEQLKKIPQFLNKRKENFESLAQQLSEIAEVRQFEPPDSRFTNSHYCLSILLDGRMASRRDEIVAFLKAREVGTSVYYPRPVPFMSYYQRKYGFSADMFPKAARISDTSIALPVGPHLSLEEMQCIADTLKDAIAHAGN